MRRDVWWEVTARRSSEKNFGSKSPPNRKGNDRGVGGWWGGWMSGKECA